ncbi:hypothetical protein AVEN_210614-1 [Araneus ventricosus]|uniref:SWIM-type domain-containing protein n=1 Tax=Araneus ventricosus TaxID=182803 RepID=A0A4Y2HXK2_ARAVE|nr:hypothetical protein AVEN_210614-1 [Araneus ventricosus]
MVDRYTYIVKGDDDNCVVNPKTVCCSCPVGLYGRYCKHQYSIFVHFDTVSSNFPPIQPRDKNEMLILALGAKVPPLEFYQPFIQENPIACEVAEEVSELSSNITVQNEDSFELNETTNSEEQKQKILQEIINDFSRGR